MMIACADFLTLIIPISRKTHQMAERFSEASKTFTDAEQIYLTTLAVSVVQDYLKVYDINSEIRLLKRVNSVPYLSINHQHKLICQSVLEDEINVHVAIFLPDSLGCVLVEINEDMTQGKVLGFVDSSISEEVTIDQLNLQSLEQFLSALQ